MRIFIFIFFIFIIMCLRYFNIKRLQKKKEEEFFNNGKILYQQITNSNNKYNIENGINKGVSWENAYSKYLNKNKE